jgi:hypothetical protein
MKNASGILHQTTGCEFAELLQSPVFLKIELCYLGQGERRILLLL